jgi:hypothetical protein
MNLPDTLDDLIGIAPDGESQLTKGQRIEQWLTAQWQFRYNEVKHVSEYKKKEGGEWKPLDNYYLNTIKRQLRDEWYLTKEQKEDGTWKEKKTYLTTTVGNLHETIESNFSPRTDVIKDYLINLMDGEPEGTAIDALADTVKMAPWYNDTQRGYWKTYLRKWLVATVANAMEDYNCKNHVCLVLVGEQGLRKGFWIEHLIQDAIGSQYVRTDGNFDPHKKDCLAAIGTYWLIHLDDMLKGLNMKDADSIKHAITCPDVKIRLPYQRMDMTLPHRASFIATVNEPDFITDTTGARRFMPFEISYIDWEAYKKVNKHQVWAEAMDHYIKKDVDYWISYHEEQELKLYKEHFAVEFTEEGLLLQHFRPWKEEVDGPESNSSRMTATMMLAHLMKEEQVFRNLSDKRLGGLLRKHGFKKKSSYINGNSVKAYMVKLIHEGDKQVSETNDLLGLAAQRKKDQHKLQAVGAQSGIDDVNDDLPF